MVNLFSIEHRRPVCGSGSRSTGDDPVLPSLFDLWPGTEAMEREAFDMFGIRFDGHPDLTRILMPEDWIGHPLRKDYDVGAIPVQFKGARGHDLASSRPSATATSPSRDSSRAAS